MSIKDTILRALTKSEDKNPGQQPQKKKAEKTNEQKKGLKKY